mmetsp:Transcript_42119/g.91803  ORF Transcript_42119/g.91803 Transcript_42119/m.91803 type:complete len:214 (-) Transcript_42119:58-699(-)
MILQGKRQRSTQKTSQGDSEYTGNVPSPVHAVVDAVEEVGRARGQADEVLLVLLHDVLHLVLQARDVVDVTHGIVGAMGGNLTSCRGVHAWELAVCLHVGVVDVHLVSAAEVLHIAVLHHGRGSQRGHGHCSCCCSCRCLLPARVEPAQESTNSSADCCNSGKSLRLSLLRLRMRGGHAHGWGSSPACHSLGRRHIRGHWLRQDAAKHQQKSG